MSERVMHTDEREMPEGGQCPCGDAAHEEGTQQSRTPRNGDGIEICRMDPGSLHGLIDDRMDGGDLLARCLLRNDPSACREGG